MTVPPPEMDAGMAAVLLRRFIVEAAGDIATRAVAIADSLDGLDSAGFDLPRELVARIALGEGYGWNMYEPATAWHDERIAYEIRDELLDAIVYRALQLRLHSLDG